MISNDDEKHLEECIRRDEQVQWCWEEMRDKWKKLAGDEKFRLLNPDLELEVLKQKLGNKTMKNYITAQRLVTAALIFCYAFCRKLVALK